MMPLTETCIQLTLGALPVARLFNTGWLLALSSSSWGPSVVTAAQSLWPDRGQPRPPGDNRADARSTMLRHDAAARRARGRIARPRTAKGWRKEYEI
ncbi:hypothetical protein LI328DRAFT_136379, partial [Trichoderma asperelloides]